MELNLQSTISNDYVPSSTTLSDDGDNILKVSTFPCRTCPATFPSLIDLELHQKTHRMDFHKLLNERGDDVLQNPSSDWKGLNNSTESSQPFCSICKTIFISDHFLLTHMKLTLCFKTIKSGSPCVYF